MSTNNETALQLIAMSNVLFKVLATYNIDATLLNAAFAEAKANGVPFDPQPFIDAAQARINQIAIDGIGMVQKALNDAQT